MAKNKVVICSKFITFAVTKTTRKEDREQRTGCDLLKIHYLCGDKDNVSEQRVDASGLWFAQNSLPLRWQRQLSAESESLVCRCDLLKIHYLCGDKDNHIVEHPYLDTVVICSKFITFAVTKTTYLCLYQHSHLLWFAQNSLPLRWQRQHQQCHILWDSVVICSKFITFAVTKTTAHS